MAVRGEDGTRGQPGVVHQADDGVRDARAGVDDDAVTALGHDAAVGSEHGRDHDAKLHGPTLSRRRHVRPGVRGRGVHPSVGPLGRYELASDAYTVPARGDSPRIQW
nr:hypothetical protein GCM10025730_53780 [Promicromonospora thailandica]